MRSLPAILGRSAGHDALLELLEIDDDVKGLKSWLVKMGTASPIVNPSTKRPAMISSAWSAGRSA